MKTKFFFILALLTLVFVFSCENWPFDINCDDCYQIEPDSADLVIRLTIDEVNPFVPVVFYKGNVESNNIEWIDTFISETATLYSKVGQYYSIEAKYLTGNGDTIIAIDGGKIKTTFIRDACDVDCWVVRGGKLDVRVN